MTAMRVKDFVRINRSTLSETTDPNLKFKYVDISAVTEGSLSIPVESVTFATAPSRARRLAGAGDVIVSTVRTYLRATAWVPEVDERLVFSTGFAVLSPTSAVDSRFLGYLCRTDTFLQEVEARSVGVSYPAVNASDIAGIRVALPTLEEQRRVADYLDVECGRIDRLMALRDQQSQGLRQALLERLRLVTTGTEDTADTAPTGVAWMPKVASGWTVPRISWVFATGSGSTPPSDAERYYDGDTPWVNTGDLDDGVLTYTSKAVTQLALDEYSALKVYAAGSLVVAMYGQGTTKGRVGLLAMSACVNQACCVLTSRGQIATEWAAHWFRAHKAEVVELAVGSGQPNLNQELIRSLRIPMPSLTEQARRLDLMRRFDSATIAAVAQMREQAELLRERRQALITAAATGQFDVSTAGRVA